MVYTVIQVLGQGGFGIVEEVRDCDGIAYARKTLIVPPTLDPNLVKPRFEREVKYQSAIKHNNVVTILDHDVNASPPWFIMPKAECSLSDDLMNDKTLGGTPHKALFHILAGLEEIHRLGYCHRDLKPQNVLKFDRGIEGIVYALSDFGLMAVGEDASTTLTPSGMGGGTPAYQAPECAVNFRRASPRSDIYSFGAILHDIFASIPKRLPHDQLSAPGKVGPVIAKCTARNVSRRYKDVAAVREALFEALDNYEFVYQSGEEQKAVEILSREVPAVSSTEWDVIFDFLDTTSEAVQPAKNIFKVLRLDHIAQLRQDDPDLMSALGRMFAKHCRTIQFGFDYCDVLADKAQVFFDFGDAGLKADMAIAMLVLGLDHNRWFVERKFLQMVGPNVDSAIIDRMIVEMDVIKLNFRNEFTRMVNSISVTQTALHPNLRLLLA